MKEIPILFTPGNVRAILDGHKTQTRRIIKSQPVRVSGGVPYRNPPASLHGASGSAIYSCPYGKRGDRLWVRETHSLITAHPIPYVVFKDGWQQYQDGGRAPGLKEYSPGAFNHIKWRPSSHMPKWAARLWLEITEIRVQRLQEMEGQHPLESDAIAEGVNRIHHGDGAYYYSAFRNDPNPKNWVDPTDAFKELWSPSTGLDHGPRIPGSGRSRSSR